MRARIAFRALIGAGLTLAWLGALLPWERVGKAFLAWSWSATGLALAPTTWSLVSAGLAAVLAVAVGACGRGTRRAGAALLAVSLVGAIAALYQFAAAGRALRGARYFAGLGEFGNLGK